MTIAPIKPLLVIFGPTASGKSELALKLAARFDGEIVNCDSVQIYRDFNIGSAKLAPAERRGIPHHLIDMAGARDHFTAGDYSRLAREALAVISNRNKLPIVCGGTGFYLRALLDGLSPAPARSHTLRERLSHIARSRRESLHRLLRRADPQTAARIHANDHQKLIRAIEMAYLERTVTSEIQSRPRDPLTGYEILKIGLNPDRKELYKRLDARSEEMFARGLVEETRSLLQQGYEPDSKPMQSLGYRQALAVLSGAETLDAAIRLCQTKTRQYAKRQMTWFRSESNVHWLQGFGSDPEVVEEAVGLVTSSRY
ncbi:MAG TPA: tRNA (adenosine(37)-N6)-dimethylallyltransferase MiaA [Bryobacteraceae bacterium]|nr:tRNA (adenosine(37)-N6)-dimethylallyltransferase MiaA [Bryobacteraceae bacterium]